MSAEIGDFNVYVHTLDVDVRLFYPHTPITHKDKDAQDI
jgi:hypothetical protein